MDATSGAPKKRPEQKQRELRVRVYNILTQEYDPEFFPSGQTDSYDGSFFFIPAEDQMIYEQWTGEVDAHGERVYENDLLQQKPDGTEPRPIMQVVFSDGMWELHSYDGSHVCPLNPVGAWMVIGNAHDKSLWKPVT